MFLLLRRSLWVVVLGWYFSLQFGSVCTCVFEGLVVMEVKILWRVKRVRWEGGGKVEISRPKPLQYDAGHCSYIWRFILSLATWRVARERVNVSGVVELLLRPDCLGR